MSRLKVDNIETRSGNNVAMDNALQLKSYTTTERDALTASAGDLIYNTTEDKPQYYDGSAWQVVGNTTEQIQDIVGAMFSGNTESNITVDYQDSDGTIDLTVAAQDSTAIVDGDSDTKIQVDENSADEDKIRYDVAGTEVAVQDAGGIALTTNGGMFRHNQTQAATFTIPSGEGTLLAGPVTITGTVTNNGTMVII